MDVKMEMNIASNACTMLAWNFKWEWARDRTRALNCICIWNFDSANIDKACYTTTTAVATAATTDITTLVE